jgi:AraC-like DNA-binding protein/ligand-binding sensor protein
VDPLLFKACEVVKLYEQAADCIVSVLGPECQPVKYSTHPKSLLFCTLCKRYYKNPERILNSEEYPCADMHVNAVKESRRLGGSYIYTCAIGFIFWTSPLYSGKRFGGALMSSGILAVERQQAIENVFRVCQGEIPREEISLYLQGLPEKTYEEVKALARMMLVCAEQISVSAEDTGKTIDRAAKPARLASQLTQTKEQPSGINYSISYPLDKERMLLASLRRGDKEEARKILGEVLDSLHAGNSAFEFSQHRAIELVVLLSRAAVNPENSEDPNALEANDRYLKKIAESQNTEELTEILNIILDRMSGRMFSFQGIRHSSALRKAERYIWENYTRKISLREIAEASGLSAPYFSTIFKDEMGENLSNYLNRLRVEKASAMLTESELSLSEIAAACGFEDQSWFSKIFKSHTGNSPGKFRELGCTFSMSRGIPDNAADESSLMKAGLLNENPIND